MPTVAFITPEEHAADLGQLRAEFYGLLTAYVGKHERWVTTEEALEAAGIKARSTLVQAARATTPDRQEPGRITYRKRGTKCLYALSSCIDYARNKQGLPALRS